MSQNTRRIEIRCPDKECKNMVGYIDVDVSKIINSIRGVTSINIDKNIICKHSFITYVDKNLAIRDSIITDFTIPLPSIEVDEDSMQLEEFNPFTLSSNLYAKHFSLIFNAIFLKINIIIISDKEILRNKLANFLKYITKNSFEINVNSEGFFYYKLTGKKSKKKYVNTLIINIDSGEILFDKNKMSISKNLEIEKKIVHVFFTESIEKSPLIMTKNEFLKAFVVCKLILESIKKKNIHTLSYLEMTERLKTKYETISFSNEYLKFITKIINNYFNYKLRTYNNFNDFMF